MGVTELVCEFLTLKAKPNLCVIFLALKAKRGVVFKVMLLLW